MRTVIVVTDAIEMTFLIDVRHEVEDSLYIASVRELQGCWASGPTAEAAVQAVIDVAKDYLATFANQRVVKVSEPQRVTAVGAEPAEVRVLATC